MEEASGCLDNADVAKCHQEENIKEKEKDRQKNKMEGDVERARGA